MILGRALQMIASSYGPACRRARGFSGRESLAIADRSLVRCASAPARLVPGFSDA